MIPAKLSQTLVASFARATSGQAAKPGGGGDHAGTAFHCGRRECRPRDVVASCCSFATVTLRNCDTRDVVCPVKFRPSVSPAGIHTVESSR